MTSYKGSAQSPDNFELTPILSIGIFVGILVAIVCIGIGTIAALKLRSHKHQQQQKFAHPNAKFSRPGNLQIKDKISLPLSHSEEMYDEKNPDVVPYNEGELPAPSRSETLSFGIPLKINGVCLRWILLAIYGRWAWGSWPSSLLCKCIWQAVRPSVRPAGSCRQNKQERCVLRSLLHFCAGAEIFKWQLIAVRSSVPGP